MKTINSNITKISKLALIAFISFSLFSCEEEVLGSDPCQSDYAYVDGEGWISERITNTNAKVGLVVKQVDKWEMGSDIFYVFSNQNTARGNDERIVYTCTNSIYREVNEDQWNDFKDSDVFRSALHTDVLYKM